MPREVQPDWTNTLALAVIQADDKPPSFGNDDDLFSPLLCGGTHTLSRSNARVPGYATVAPLSYVSSSAKRATVKAMVVGTLSAKITSIKVTSTSEAPLV